MKFKPNLIVWLWLLLLCLTAQNCVNSKPSKLELQQRDLTIQSNALNISDADAAIAAYGMLLDCEDRLIITTDSLRNERRQLPKQKKIAFWRGIGVGGSLGALLVLILQ